MTAYSTLTGGDAAAPGTWSPNGVPGTGDSEQIIGSTVAYQNQTAFDLEGMAITLTGTAELIFPDYLFPLSITLGVDTSFTSTAAATNATLSFAYNLTNAGTITANSSGGSLAIHASRWTTALYPISSPGSFFNTGTIVAQAGVLSITTLAFGPQPYIPYPLTGVFENDGVVAVLGGSLLVSAPVTTATGKAGTINLAAGSAEFTKSVDSSQTVLLGAPATLRIDAPAAFHAAIRPLAGATIDLGGVGTATAVTYAGADIIDVAGPSGTVPLHLPGYATAGLVAQAAADGTGGTLLHFAAAPALPLPPPSGGVVDASGTPALTLAVLFNEGYVPQFLSGTASIRLLDGTLSVGADTSEAFVQRLYEGLLGRAADPVGLVQWDGLLGSGAAYDSVAAGVLGSAEYASLHPGGIPTDAQFVAGLYQGFFARTPDPGQANWTAALAGGETRQQVAAAFAQCLEAKAHWAAATQRVWAPNATAQLIDRLYNTAFGRVPDAGGLAAFTKATAGGTTAFGLAYAVIASAEFQAIHAGQGAAQLIASFYQAGLGRAPGTAESQAWGSVLAAGGRYEDVLLGIARAPETVALLSPSL